jgi:hypothetical protein
MLCGMFCIDESTAAAIRQAFHEGGELSAAIELRRHFPGIADNANARRCARTIASWEPVQSLTIEKGSRKRLRHRPADASHEAGR